MFIINKKVSDCTVWELVYGSYVVSAIMMGCGIVLTTLIAAICKSFTGPKRPPLNSPHLINSGN